MRGSPPRAPSPQNPQARSTGSPGRTGQALGPKCRFPLPRRHLALPCCHVTHVKASTSASPKCASPPWGGALHIQCSHHKSSLDDTCHVASRCFLMLVGSFPMTFLHRDGRATCGNLRDQGRSDAAWDTPPFPCIPSSSTPGSPDQPLCWAEGHSRGRRLSSTK